MQARELGIRDAEFGARLNFEARKTRVASEARKSYKALILPSILLFIGVFAIVGLLVERNF